MQDFRKLAVWQKAHAVALDAHRLTQDWPRRDNAGLIGQIRRAALSIPSNIAEGCGRATSGDLAKFLQIAIGSSVELEYQLEFAAAAGIMQPSDFELRQERVVEVRKMLVGLLRRIRREQGVHSVPRTPD